MTLCAGEFRKCTFCAVKPVRSLSTVFIHPTIFLDHFGMGGIKPNHPIYLWWEGQSARAKMSISHRASLRTRQPAPRLLLVSSQPSVDNAGGQKFTLISFCEAQTRVESLLRSERRAK